MSGLDGLPNDEQRLNVYGELDDKVMLQASNGKYLEWNATDGWSASETDLNNASTFQVRQNNGTFTLLGDNGFYMSAQGASLVGVGHDHSIDDSMLFSKYVVTASLMDLYTGDSSLNEGLDLRWVSFGGANWSEIRLPKCDLSNADLSGATLTDADFTSAILRDAVLRGATVGTFTGGTSFRSADLSGTDMTGSYLDATEFRGANLRGAVLDRATINSADFTGADLSGVVLDRATINWADFTGTDLSGVDLSGVVFRSGMTLSHATAKGTNFTGIDLSGMDLTSVTFDSNTVFKRAELDGADLTGQTLDGMDFSGASLSGTKLDKVSAKRTDFAGADLSGVSALGSDQGVSFSGGDLSNAKLANAKLKGARFDAEGGLPAAVLAGVFMPNADLTSANLDSVDMSGVQLYGSDANLGNANLRNAILPRANLATMDLTQANMNGAVLSYANLVNTNFRGASLARGDENRAVALVSASLQGADLTEASLPGADLTNAAVALSIQGPVETFVGVPLFDIADTSLSSDLDQKQLSAALKNAFSNAGYPLIDTAAVTVAGSGQQWSIDNYDKSGSGLQSTYGTFSLVLRAGQPHAIRVYGSPPLLVIAYNADNEQTQQAPGFTETVGLTDAIDDETTCPNGMRWSQRNQGVEVETLMTAAEPPHPPQCVPSEDNWCYIR